MEGKGTAGWMKKNSASLGYRSISSGQIWVYLNRAIEYLCMNQKRAPILQAVSPSMDSLLGLHSRELVFRPTLHGKTCTATVGSPDLAFSLSNKHVALEETRLRVRAASTTGAVISCETLYESFNLLRPQCLHLWKMMGLARCHLRPPSSYQFSIEIWWYLVGIFQTISLGYSGWVEPLKFS